MLLLLGRSFYVLLVSHLIQNHPLFVMRNYAWNTCLLLKGIEDFDSFSLRKFQWTFSHLLSILMNYTWIIGSFSAYNILIVFESTSNILFLVHSTMRRLTKCLTWTHCWKLKEVCLASLLAFTSLLFLSLHLPLNL